MILIIYSVDYLKIENYMPLVMLRNKFIDLRNTVKPLYVDNWFLKIYLLK
jgi:hypothetical protein